MITEQESLRRFDVLTQHLTTHFGVIGKSTLKAIQDSVEWVELEAGGVLMHQGDAGDAAFLTLSGRLRVSVKAEDGTPRMVRELGRGEVTGEMSLYTGEPRSATVTAVRRTLLARLDKTHFHALIARNPQVSVAVTNKIIQRLQTQNNLPTAPAPVMVTLLPVSEGVDTERFADRLVTALAPYGRACILKRDAFRQRAAVEGANATTQLDELEALHDVVLMVADPQDLDWSAECAAHSDEILLLADATQPPGLHPVEDALLARRSDASKITETLVMLHPATTRHPTGMRRWLDRRPVTGHVNLRWTLDSDMSRLARLLTRQAVGLVLAGGGARGFAHLGIWKVLREQGVEIDCVGGTSMGAVMAAVIAADREVNESLGIVKRAFQLNPTGDYNLVPLISLIRGERVRQIIRRSLDELMGGPGDIADLWKGYFCIASNYSQGREVCFDRGDLAKSLRASIAIPGALPPVVHEGDLLCDGGTFNNFPVDVMRQMRGVGKVIGVDLGARTLRRLAIQETPSPWALLWDRLRLRGRRRYRLPTLLSYLLNVSILYSVSRQPQSKRLTDLYFNPPLLRVGLLQWNRFAAIVRQGEAHARDVLAGLSERQRSFWGITGTLDVPDDRPDWAATKTE